MRLSRESKIITFVFILNTLIVAYLTIVTKHTPVLDGPLFHYGVKGFLLTLNLFIYLTGFFGLLKAHAWGGWKSVMGRAVGSLSLGMITWATGNMIWVWYLFYANVEVPYPSLADAIFVLSWPLWSYGVWNLSKATGAKFGLRTTGGKFLLVLVPLACAALSYYLLIMVARGGVIDFNVDSLQLFFDLFYPFGSMVIFSIVGVVYMLSRNFLGGRYRIAILLLFLGFIGNYISDFTFSYTTNTGTYFNASLIDYIFSVSLYLISMGITNLDPNMIKQKMVHHTK
jgi:hypothetical protein